MDARDDIGALLAAARGGEPHALGRIFEAARGHLLHVAERELPPELRAKIGASDLVQETAIDMQRNFARFTGSTADECFAWLREILCNNAVDAVRHYRDRLKRAVDREVSLPAHASRATGPFVDPRRSPDASAMRREEAAALADVLPRLPEEERQVLDLRYGSGLSFAEIAARLGRSPKTVRKIWYRALALTQRELAANGLVPAAPAEPAAPSP